MKEKYFKDYDEFWDYLLDHNCIHNVKNFSRFSLEPISRNKVHLGRYFLLQKENGELYIKYKTTLPKNKIIAYANVIHKKGLENDNRNVK